MTPEQRRRRWLFAALYLCEGAPIGFLWWALPTILTERGAEPEAVGTLLSWLVLPWALKFLWAPLIDLGGGRRLGRWIVAAQLLMALTLVPLLFRGTGSHLGWVGAALLLHALAAASQDAAIDALAIRSVPPGERGRLNGWMQVGMLFGRSLFGGGALLVRGQIGDRGVLLLLISGLSSVALGLAWRGRSWLGAPLAPREARVSLGSHLRQALGRRVTWVALLFAATSGAGFEVVGVFAGPLLVSRGLDSRVVGLFLGLFAVAAMAGGAALGGRLSDRWSARRCVLVAGLWLGASVLLLAGLCAGPSGPLVLRAVLLLVYLGIGAFTASSYALFMQLSDPALGATQFSAYMGATNLCESWSARLGGRLASGHGYGSAFAAPALIALASLALLGALRPSVPRREELE